MSDDMIERMARAICHSIDGDEEDWLAFTTAAYDTLVAMQEPTEAMKAAAVAAAMKSPLSCRPIWDATIAAAFGEKAAAA